MRQVLVPEEGCRLILGTDGLWDFLATSKVFSLVSRMAPAAAAATLCKQAFTAQVCASTCLHLSQLRACKLHQAGLLGKA